MKRIYLLILIFIFDFQVYNRRRKHSKKIDCYFNLLDPDHHGRNQSRLRQAKPSKVDPNLTSNESEAELSTEPKKEAELPQEPSR